MVQPEEVRQSVRRLPSQVAHWMTFKEDQRLDWQQKYLTQLCEADPEIPDLRAPSGIYHHATRARGRTVR